MTQPGSRSLRLAAVLSLCAVLPLLSGCAQLTGMLNGGGFQTPTLSFEKASVRDLALDHVTLDVTFLINNPNSIGIDLASVAYDLQIEGHSLVSGKPDLGIKIPASGSGELIFPCTIRFVELANGLQAALAKKIVHWKASGEAGVNSPIGVISLPLSAEGDVTLPVLPTVSLQAPRVASAGFTSARIIFPITVQNPNSFPIPFGGVSGSVTLQGAQIGQASSASSATSIAAASTQTVELALDVSFLSAGAGVAEAIANGAADVGVDGAVDVAGFKLPLSIRQHVQLGK